MGLNILEQSGPVVGRRDFHVGFEVGIMSSENAIVSLALGFLLILLGQEQRRPRVLVVGQPDLEDVVLVVESSFHQIR